MKAFRHFVCAFALFGFLAACSGGGAKVESQSTISTKSQGEQLIDLKKALDQGAITEDEYKKLRKRIIDGK